MVDTYPGRQQQPLFSFPSFQMDSSWFVLLSGALITIEVNLSAWERQEKCEDDKNHNQTEPYEVGELNLKPGNAKCINWSWIA